MASVSIVPPLLLHAVLQGLGATILRNTPANAVYLGTFEVLKSAAAKQLGCQVSNADAVRGRQIEHSVCLQGSAAQCYAGVLKSSPPATDSTVDLLLACNISVL